MIVFLLYILYRCLITVHLINSLHFQFYPSHIYIFSVNSLFLQSPTWNKFFTLNIRVHLYHTERNIWSILLINAHAYSITKAWTIIIFIMKIKFISMRKQNTLCFRLSDNEDIALNNFNLLYEHTEILT